MARKDTSTKQGHTSGTQQIDCLLALRWPKVGLTIGSSGGREANFEWFLSVLRAAR